MIRLRDAMLLTITKLRTRPVRTIVTVTIAALLFGVLFFVLLVATGVFQSLERFSSHGLTSRFLAMGTYSSPYISPDDPVLIARAKEIYKANLAAKKTEAKRLGLDETWAASTEAEPVNEYGGSGEWLNWGAPSAMQAIAELRTGQKIYEAQDFFAVAEPYHPIHTYTALVLFPKNGRAVMLKNGQEEFFDVNSKQNEIDYSNPPPLASVANVLPKTLLGQFLIPGSSWTPESGRVPIILSQQQAEKMLGMKKPASSASATERLNYTRTLMEKAKDHSFKVCYRNQTSQNLVQHALQTSQEIEKNKKNPDYVKPSLIYTLPEDASSCGAVNVVRDVRTWSEKQRESKERAFLATFGQPYIEPSQAMIELQIVGISPGYDYASPGSVSLASSLSDTMQMIFMSQIMGDVIPQEMYDQLPADSAFKRVFTAEVDSSQSSVTFSSRNGIVEFSDASAAKRFIDEQTCQIGSMGGCDTVKDPTKQFMIQPVGSNSLSIDEMRQKFMNIFMVGMLVVVVVAAIILSFTVSRTIVDGRRETAVFRAIGFSRVDIAQVYVGYVVALGCFVALTGLILGVIGALVVDSLYSVDMTLGARLAFGDYGDTMFSLFSLGTPYLLMLVAVVIGVAIVSSVFPLVRNVRRNPIRDMRDE